MTFVSSTALLSPTAVCKEEQCIYWVSPCWQEEWQGDPSHVSSYGRLLREAAALSQCVRRSGNRDSKELRNLSQVASQVELSLSVFILKLVIFPQQKPIHHKVLHSLWLLSSSKANKGLVGRSCQCKTFKP